jgi:transcriptional regulator with XRE-family HTH domain
MMMRRHKSVRLALGLSQSEVARRSGLHYSTISLAESRRFVLSATQLEKLARGLGYGGDPADLLDDIRVAE